MTPHDRPQAGPRRDAPRPYRPHDRPHNRPHAGPAAGALPREDVADRILDAEVVAVEVFDPPRGRADHPAADLPRGAAGPADGPAPRPVAHGAGSDAPWADRSAPARPHPAEEGLEDSLDQIERLAAELKEIAQVIDPDSGGAASGRSPYRPAATAGRPDRPGGPLPHPTRTRAATATRRPETRPATRRADAAPGYRPRPAAGGRPPVDPPGSRRHRNDREPGDRRRRALLMTGVLLLALPAFALGAVQPWNGLAARDDRLTVSGPQPTPPPPPGGAPTGPAVSAPVPSTAVAGPSASGQPGAGAGPTDGPPGGAPSAAPSSRPGPAAAGLSVRVHASNVRPVADEAVTFTVSWTDGSGMHAGTTVDWGDGGSSGGPVRPRSCSGQAPASQGTSSFRHAFAAPGRYVVTVRVTTSGCDGRVDVRDVPMTIQVSAAPSPTPSPTTPSPTDTGSTSPPPSPEPTRRSASATPTSVTPSAT